ncbi:MAG TPA: leucine--tRNA ligase [Anaerolineales bacterium]|nr:leucine--tRNA ligase [Anaerolineales bacterium]
MTEFQAEDFSEKEKIYVLAEFPYPSGSGLHIGHAFTYTGGDVYARFQRMHGRNVLFPMGWDAFGLPTENYAIRSGQKPQDVTKTNTENYREQMDAMGFSFDWSREVNTTDPNYYKWTQWIFIKLFERGLAYKAEMPINWCPSCKVGLANEEVINGHCERCGTEVTRRRISQWVVRITQYADRLISGLEQTEFIEKVKAAQVNWIGRSEGAKIRFQVPGDEQDDTLEIFTTRPDTLWGCTFMVIAPEHELVAEVMDKPEVAEYVEQSQKRSELERAEESRPKEGVFSGLRARHPATGQELPIWISDFVLPSYGTGAIMAVPAHDERDHQFALKYGLPIQPVILPATDWDFAKASYLEMDGTMVNSGPLDGLSPTEAIPFSIDWLASEGLGERAVSYHLRDWIFSRQHYWGEPIPMIDCQECGWNPVPEDQLPVLLPEVDRYEPTETGESPLANISGWVDVRCPNCGGPARRETDTMPNWAGSDWYFLRFCDPHNDHALADLDKLRYWMPVDVYIGGDEHNTLHLLYSRFIYLFLHDLGVVPPEYPEPYLKRLSHGVILGPDGQRMSKTRGNVIVPQEYVERYGADSLRVYLLFLGPYDATMAWNERALLGVKRFLDRFTRFVRDHARQSQESGPRVKAAINRMGREVAEDTTSFKYNTAIAHMMETLNTLQDLVESKEGQHENVADQELCLFSQILAPYAPFTAESCWQIAGGKNSVHKTRWPVYDPDLELEELITIAIQVNGKLRGTVAVPQQTTESEIRQLAEAEPGIAKFLMDKNITKVIYVPLRTMNFVVK